MNKNTVKKLLALCQVPTGARKGSFSLSDRFSEVALFEKLLSFSYQEIEQYFLEIILQCSRKGDLEQKKINTDGVYVMVFEAAEKFVYIPTLGANIFWPSFCFPTCDQIKEESDFYRKVKSPLSFYAQTPDSWHEFVVYRMLHNVLLCARLYTLPFISLREYHDGCAGRLDLLLWQQQITIDSLRRKVRQYRTLDAPIWMQQNLANDLAMEAKLMRFLKEYVD